MDNVVQQAFSITAKPDIDDNLLKLKTCIKDTGLSETLKLHCILHHIPHALHYLYGKGLGIWSEQAGESIHRIFLKFWDKYKMNNMYDPAYEVRLKRAVVEFSSHHL